MTSGTLITDKNLIMQGIITQKQTTIHASKILQSKCVTDDSIQGNMNQQIEGASLIHAQRFVLSFFVNLQTKGLKSLKVLSLTHKIWNSVTQHKMELLYKLTWQLFQILRLFVVVYTICMFTRLQSPCCRCHATSKKGQEISD